MNDKRWKWFGGFVATEVLQEWRDVLAAAMYIHFSDVFLEMMSRPEARKDGWNCLAHFHTKVFGRVMLVKKNGGDCLLALYPLCFFEM